MPELSHAGGIARLHDPDRFLTALFAPAARREALFLLIAFNHELVRAVEMPSTRGDAGPIAALIRLQWWREVVEGTQRRHELAAPVGDALQAGLLDRASLLMMIEAREAEAEAGAQATIDWRAAQLAGAGGVQVAFGLALGVPEPERLRAVGAAYAAGATHRHQASLRQAGRLVAADDVLHDAGRAWLADAGTPRVGSARVAAWLPAVLARRDLARPPQATPRGLGDRLALVAAWVRGVA